MALPLIQAIGAGLSAFNAANTVSSWMSGDSKAATATGATTAASSAAGQTKAADQEDRFLRLLVTQMRNQDPLNPLDNAQVTTQMAQISTVSGVDKLNGTIEKLSQSMLSSQSLQSAAVIGHQVLASGTALSLGAVGADGALELSQSVDRMQVTITTPAGAVVRRLEFGAQNAGTFGFQWDGMTDGGGRAPQGNYIFQVAAASGGQSIPVTTLTAGRVAGVSFNGGSLMLNLESGADLQVADVRRIL